MKAELDDTLMLILEGTYPYVRGGVSEWVERIIEEMPEIRFSVIFIGSRREDYEDKSYEIPPNVVFYRELFLFEEESPELSGKVAEPEPEKFRVVDEFHESVARLLSGECPVPPDLAYLYGDHCDIFNRTIFNYSEAGWDFITRCFQERSTDPSFIDYFWTVRNLHKPLWSLLELVERLPQAAAYHSVSTGYAGFLGALLQHRHGKPYILMEHGIYTKERRIDLLSADWISEHVGLFRQDPGQASHLRELWIRFFEVMGKFAYHGADPVISLFSGARRQQIEDGVDSRKTRIIPNGVDVARFAPLRGQRSDPPPKVLCLLGRVVPIKDIKTFIRAMRTVVNRVPEAEGWVVGPTDEDPEYYAECQRLVYGLGLEGKVRFLGFQKVGELLPQVGLMVLSSISEGLPLVLLEGFASGLPCVTTDVGACRELIEGRDDEDRSLGTAGRVVGIADPAGLAEAALELMTDPEAWFRAQQVAISRVERYYTKARMVDQFRNIYNEAISWRASALNLENC